MLQNFASKLVFQCLADTQLLLLKEMKKTATQLADYYKSWLDKYPFVSIEDCNVPIFRTEPPSLKLVERCETVS